MTPLRYNRLIKQFSTPLREAFHLEPFSRQRVFIELFFNRFDERFNSFFLYGERTDVRS